MHPSSVKKKSYYYFPLKLEYHKINCTLCIICKRCKCTWYNLQWKDFILKKEYNKSSNKSKTNCYRQKIYDFSPSTFFDAL